MSSKETRVDLKSSSMMIFGILLSISGIIIMITREKLVFTLIQLISAFLIVSSTIELALLVLGRKDHKHISLSSSMIGIIIGLIVLLFTTIPVSIIVILFGIYGVCSGVAKLITYYLYKKDQIKGRLILLIDSLLFIILSLSIIFSPIHYAGQLFFLIGLYALTLGYTYIRDSLSDILPTSAKTRFKRRIRVNLPIFLVAIIPYRMLNIINHYLSDYDDDGKVTEFVESKVDEKPDLEVLIHVTKDGYGTLGHVDLVIKDQVISYGNYDTSSFHLFEAIGDGILFTAPKQEYIAFCIEHSKKTLFSFGLKLDDEQYERVIEKLREIEKRLYRWYTPYELEQTKTKKYDDYPSLLVKEANAKLFKFNKSRFKTYFVLSTNCVLLVDSVLGKAGTDLLNINGVITPGTYYDYFDREFHKKNSMVISKKIYK